MKYLTGKQLTVYVRDVLEFDVKRVDDTEKALSVCIMWTNGYDTSVNAPETPHLMYFEKDKDGDIYVDMDYLYESGACKLLLELPSVEAYDSILPLLPDKMDDIRSLEPDELDAYIS